MTKSAPAIIAACVLLALPAAQHLRQPAEVVPALPERSAPEDPDTTSTSATDPQVSKQNPPRQEQRTYEFPLVVLDHVGSWIPWIDQWRDPRRLATFLVDYRGYKTTPAEAQEVLAGLDRLSGFFRQLKVLNPPKGLQVWPHRYVGADGFQRDPGSPALPCQLLLGFKGYYSVCDTCKTFLDTGDEGLGWIQLWVNNATVVSGSKSPYREDERGPMYSVPRIIGNVAGFPEYDSGFIVLTRIQRPLWIPVSQERYIRNEIREWQARLAEYREHVARGTPYEIWLKEEPQRRKGMEESARRWQEDYERLKKSNPQAAEELRRSTLEALQLVEQTEKQVTESLKAGDASEREDRRKGLERHQQLIRSLEAELASLSPAERAAPAHLFGGRSHERPSGLADPTTRGSQMLVETNRDFFDRSLPPTAIQLIAVEGLKGVESDLEGIERRGTSNPRSKAYFIARTTVEIRRTLPWQAMASLLEGK